MQGALGGQVRTGMVDDGQLAVGLLDLELGGGGLDTQGVVVGRVDNHVGGL